MAKELNVKKIDKDFRQIFVEEKPTNIFINEDGQIRTKSLKETLDNELVISPDKIVLKSPTIHLDGNSVNLSTITGNELNFQIDGDIVHKKISDDANGAVLILQKERAGLTAQDDDYVGNIQFKAYDDESTPDLMTTGEIRCQVLDVSGSDEIARFEMRVLSDEFSDVDTPSTFLRADGINSGGFGQINTSIGAGGSSTMKYHSIVHEFQNSGLGSDASAGVITLETRSGGVVNPSIKIESNSDDGDYLKVDVGTHGASTIETVDDGASKAHLTIKPDGSLKLNPANGNYVAQNNGTEFSAANSAYAGMILGYTRIANDSTSHPNQYIAINSSTMTVLQTAQGTDLSVAFTAPPSGKVEINFSCWMTAVTGGAKFSLSTASSYSELDETHTYDADQNVYIDESDHYIHNVNFSVSGLTAGTSYTYYIAGLASEANVYIAHGRNRTFGTFFPPIIIKAIALPQSITTGE